MPLIDIKNIKDEAAQELRAEVTRKAKEALKGKLRNLENARQIVRNIEREIEDIEASIADGSFTG